MPYLKENADNAVNFLHMCKFGGSFGFVISFILFVLAANDPVGICLGAVHSKMSEGGLYPVPPTLPQQLREMCLQRKNYSLAQNDFALTLAVLSGLFLAMGLAALLIERWENKQRPLVRFSLFANEKIMEDPLVTQIYKRLG